MSTARGLKVRVYWNLHKKCWSLQHNGKVIEHADCVMLDDVEFVVRPGGREKVRKEKRKNVHAFAFGIVTAAWKAKDHPESCRVVRKYFESGDGSLVTYNPYVNETFVDKETGEPVLHSKHAVLGNRKVKVYG